MDFKLKYLDDYHDLYEESDTLLLVLKYKVCYTCTKLFAAAHIGAGINSSLDFPTVRR